MKCLCELCGVEPAFNFHHFIPRMLHSNRWFKQRYTRQEMARGIHLCRLCHQMIHTVIPREKEIGRKYHSRDLLLAHPEIEKFVQWRRRRLRA